MSCRGDPGAKYTQPCPNTDPILDDEEANKRTWKLQVQRQNEKVRRRLRESTIAKGRKAPTVTAVTATKT